MEYRLLLYIVYAHIYTHLFNFYIYRRIKIMLLLFHDDSRDGHFRSNNKLFRLLQPLICWENLVVLPFSLSHTHNVIHNIAHIIFTFTVSIKFYAYSYIRENIFRMLTQRLIIPRNCNNEAIYYTELKKIVLSEKDKSDYNETLLHPKFLRSSFSRLYRKV